VVSAACLRVPVHTPEPLFLEEESTRVTELLRGHGGTLKRARACGRGERLLSSAVRAGALPNLTSFDFFLYNPTHRDTLSGGVLPLFEEVEVIVRSGVQEQFAALGNLRPLQHLRRLSLKGGSAGEPAFPRFTPPSFKTLSLCTEGGATLESLLRELHLTLQASGASPQDTLTAVYHSELSAETGATLAQVLRACSSTLKTVRLVDPGGRVSSTLDLVPGLLSCCDALEVLSCPWAVLEY
jgi:hypothetical protein